MVSGYYASLIRGITPESSKEAVRQLAKATETLKDSAQDYVYFLQAVGKGLRVQANEFVIRDEKVRTVSFNDANMETLVELTDHDDNRDLILGLPVSRVKKLVYDGDYFVEENCAKRYLSKDEFIALIEEKSQHGLQSGVDITDEYLADLKSNAAASLASISGATTKAGFMKLMMALNGLDEYRPALNVVRAASESFSYEDLYKFGSKLEMRFLEEGKNLEALAEKAPASRSWRVSMLDSLKEFGWDNVKTAAKVGITLVTVAFLVGKGYSAIQSSLDIELDVESVEGLEDTLGVRDDGNETDTDGDGMPDWWEEKYGLDLNDPSDADEDPDRDNLTNVQEYDNKTDLQKADTDDDRMPDGWEVQYGLDPLDASDRDEDLDGDVLWNEAEYIEGTDPTNPDTDGDGMDDLFDAAYLDPLDPSDAGEDLDEDGLSNLAEDGNYTDPTNPDTDEDGMPDGWEVEHGLNPKYDYDASEDLDEDGMTNLKEYELGFDPTDPSDADADLDGDGASNIYESVRETDPRNSDSDGDGLPDGWEIEYDYRYGGNSVGTDPLNPDADADPDKDNLTNLEEYNAGTDPTEPDTDNDGFKDNEEIRYGWNPLGADDWFGDADGDGILNNDEVYYGLDPSRDDAGEDPDGDGLANRDEVKGGVYTDPFDPDTDDDGLPDGFEVKYNDLDPHTNDSSKDGDNDGLTTLQEYEAGTLHYKSDSDGDGYNDGDELNVYGTDPLDPKSHPPEPDEGMSLEAWLGIVGGSFLLLGGAGVTAGVLYKRGKSEKQDEPAPPKQAPLSLPLAAQENYPPVVPMQTQQFPIPFPLAKQPFSQSLPIPPPPLSSPTVPLPPPAPAAQGKTLEDFLD